MPPLSIAIDFGTTRTKVAYFDEQRHEARLVELGREIRTIVPSVFYVPTKGKGNPCVGDDALDMIDRDPEGLHIGLKREIHRTTKIRFGSGRKPMDRCELASELFSYIRKRCSEEVFHEEVTRCVLTVPAQYEQQKRECIRRAAELGGFTNISSIEEPVAAAKAWLAESGQKGGNHIVVCDVGGGTTDFALVHRDGEHCEIVPEATDGFDRGGNDVDEALLDYVLEQADKSEDRVLQYRHGFLTKVRQEKELLFRHSSDELKLSLKGMTFLIGRNTVVECAKDFIELVKKHTGQFLERCNAVASDPPVLLVGGGSHLPGLKEAVETLASGRVFQWNQSDYATVLGAVERPRVPSKKAAGKPKADKPTAVTEKPPDPSPQTLALVEQVQTLLESVAKTEERESEQCRELIKSAIDHAQAACDLDPGYAVASFWKGEALSAKSDWLLAISAYTMALRSDETHADAWQQRGWARYQEDDCVAARNDLDRALQLKRCSLGFARRAEIQHRLGNTRDATNDLQAALADETQTTFTRITRAALATIGGVLIADELDQPDESIAWFSKAMAALPRRPVWSDILQFDKICRDFRVEKYLFEQSPSFADTTQDDDELVTVDYKMIHPWRSLQDKLWNSAMKEYSGCTIDAVSRFITYNDGHDVPHDSVWSTQPEFAYYQAVIHADNNDPDLVMLWLFRLLKVDDYDFTTVLTDKRIRRAAKRHVALKSLLTPTWRYTENHGWVLNDVTVENSSPYSLDSVVVTVESRREDDKGKKVVTKKLTTSQLKANETKVWGQVFKDGGLWGNKLTSVKVSLKCAGFSRNVPVAHAEPQWIHWRKDLRFCPRECHFTLSKFWSSREQLSICPRCFACWDAS